MPITEFEREIGVWKSFYGNNWKFYLNGREVKKKKDPFIFR
jgi:hypothetical protein